MLPKGVAKTAARINPDGMGIIWLDTFEVSHHKSSEFKKLNTERPFIAHFRYATVGEVSRDNTHPFRCGSNKNEWLMMNGTIGGLGNHKVCDSRVLADKMGDIPRHKWKSELEKYDSRFVTVNTRLKTYQVYNRQLWTERDGILYSKDNVLERHLVAVYGTLKKGNSNYYRYLNTSRYVGKGETADKYPLIVDGLPYLIDAVGDGHNVEVDVFRVSDTKLRDIDQLEGHPTWYCRKQIDVVVKGRKMKAWIYFNPSQSHSGKKMHKSYDPYADWGRRDINYYSGSGSWSWWNKRDEQVSSRSWWGNITNDDRKELVSQTSLFDDVLDYPLDTDDMVGHAVCIDCFHDLEYDGFMNYHCTGCDAWFGSDEILMYNDSNQLDNQIN